MPKQSTLTLYIPDLFGFQSILPTLSKDELSQLPAVNFPILEKWLSRGLKEKVSSPQDVVFSEFGLLLEQGKGQPAAALSLLAEKNVEFEVSKDTYWLRADPVNLQADGDSALLVAHEELALTQEEANTLVELINKHFIDEPWTLFCFEPHRWYLRLDKPADLITTPLKNVLGDDVSLFMPTGSDANYWWKIINELQMLLHGSHINFERDSRNIVTANSVWLWGGGCLPERDLSSPDYDNVITDNILFSGIAHHCGFNVLPLKDDLLAGIAHKNNFIVLDMLSEHVRRRDLYTFMQILNELEEKSLMRCHQYLEDGSIEKIKIITGSATNIIITKKQLRRWWKRIKPFSGFKDD